MRSGVRITEVPSAAVNAASDVYWVPPLTFVNEEPVRVTAVSIPASMAVRSEL
jgi:hypothetical protein